MASLLPLLETRRVILCVGCGGVGKTTTTAALGLGAAMRGKRVLCLTIDPAKRLANSLGLEAMDTEAQTVAPELFARAGLDVPGSLTVMMLDTKRTFDALVARHASSPEARDKILHNKLYHHVSTSLAGTHEYMAMEKLYEVRASGDWDLIVLDTPPTSNALDFLDAPERLVGALDGAAVKWLIQAFQGTGALSLNLLAKSAAVVLKGISKLTGGGFLEDLAAFVTELNDLFGGWKQRAAEVSKALREPDVAYVLVTSPAPLAIEEVLFFGERLRSQGMREDAFVVNRVHTPPAARPAEADVRRVLAERGLDLGDDGPERLLRALGEEAQQAEIDRENLRALDGALRGSRALRADVPAYAADVHDLRALASVTRALVGDA